MASSVVGGVMSTRNIPLQTMGKAGVPLLSQGVSRQSICQVSAETRTIATTSVVIRCSAARRKGSFSGFETYAVSMLAPRAVTRLYASSQLRLMTAESDERLLVHSRKRRRWYLIVASVGTYWWAL